jgi:hypothetical protein
MKRNFLVLCLAAALVLPGCVKVDSSLGKGLVDKSLLFDTYTQEFPLEEIQLKAAETLSGYSDTRLTIGAIRDEVFGLTTREAAFNLLPALDTLDLGTNPKAVSFTLYFEADSVSCSMDSEAHIFQSLYVTELTKPLPTSEDDTRNTQEIPHGTQIITNGLPVYKGENAISFNFNLEYAQKFVDKLKEIGPVFKDQENEDGIDKYDELVAALPGIHIRTSEPEGIGGRINMFKFSCLSVSSSYYVQNSNFGRLTVNSTWDGVQKDSTFLIIPGEPELYDEEEYVANNTKFYQYCFNRTTQSTVAGPVTDKVLVEGGGGLKPVILAKELQTKTREAIAAKGGDPDKGVIIKASIILPFRLPEDLDDLKYFPSILSPTIQTTYETEGGVERPTFAGLTDASISTEDQGDIDRSTLVYKPDITYHVQEILTRTDLDTATDADIWLLTIHTEKVANANGSLYDNEYYKNLLYASYYNSLYGGGYGGYGGYGYGGYGGYGYSNYYNYMMLASYMSASSQQTYSYNSELDKDRYYCAILNGPKDSKAPMFRITFAIPKD